MIGKLCQHSKTKQFGKITQELKTYSPEQWGIRWNQGCFDYFWHDKAKIIIMKKYYLIGDIVDTEKEAHIIQNKFTKLNFESTIFKVISETPVNKGEISYFITLKAFDMPNEITFKPEYQDLELKIIKNSNLFTEKELNYMFITYFEKDQTEIKINNQKSNKMNNQIEAEKIIKGIRKNVGEDALLKFYITEVEDIIKAINYWTKRKHGLSPEDKATVNTNISILEGILIGRATLTKDAFLTATENNIAILDSLTPPSTTDELPFKTGKSREEKETIVSKRILEIGKKKKKESEILSKPETNSLDVLNELIDKNKDMSFGKFITTYDGEKDEQYALALWKSATIDEVDPRLDTGATFDTYFAKRIKGEKQKDTKKTEDKAETTEFPEVPTLRDLSQKCKELILENKEDEALTFATKYLEEGNYTPKKANKTARKWELKVITSWFNDIKLNATVPKTEKNDDKERNIETKHDDPSEEEKTNKPTINTLYTEQEALINFGDTYSKLMEKGSEDKEAAKEALAEFFKTREYSDQQIKNWTDAILDENNKEEDPFAMMNPEWKESEITSTIEDLKVRIETALEKDDDFETILLATQTDLIGTTIVDTDKIEHRLYTKYHVEELVKDQSTKIKEQQLKNLEDSTSTKEVVKDPTPIKVKEYDGKTVPLADVQDAMYTLIKNGGIKEDIADNVKFHKMVNKQMFINEKETKVFETKETMISEFLNDLYDELKERFGEDNPELESIEKGMVKGKDKNESKVASYDEFLKHINKAIKDNKSVEEFVNENLSFVQYTDDETNVTYKDMKSEDVKVKQGDYVVCIINSKEDFEAIVKKTFADNTPTVKTETDTKEESTEKAEINTENEPTFDSFNDIKPMGIKLIEEKGYDFEHILAWVMKNILNKRLKETKGDDLITSEKTVTQMTKGFFRDYFKEEKAGFETKDITAEIEKIAIEEFKKEGLTIANITTTIRTHLKKLQQDKNITFDMPSLKKVFSQVVEISEEHAPDLYEKWKNNNSLEKEPAITDPKTNTCKIDEKDKSKVFVEEIISVSDPKFWAKHKNATSLEELHEPALTLIKADNWKKALSLYLQVIALGDIEEAKDWDSDAIAKWFIEKYEDETIEEDTTNTENEESNVEEDKETENEESNTEDTTKNEIVDKQDLANLILAKNKTDFKQSLQDIMTDKINNDKLKDIIIEAIQSKDNERGNYVKKIAKMKEQGFSDMIDAAKRRTEKHDA